MGGDVFGTTAVRLTPSAFSTLCAHISEKLEGLEIAFPPSLPKETHGDVDVLLGTTFVGLKGRTLGFPAAVPGTASDLAELERGGPDGLCAALCARLGAQRWLRNGNVASFAVPVTLLAPSAAPAAHEARTRAAGAAGDEFYQVDVILVPARSLPWARMATTFSQGRQLLNLVARAALGSSRVRTHDMSLGFLSRLGEIELTTDVGRTCAWLGLRPYDAYDFESTALSASAPSPASAGAESAAGSTTTAAAPEAAGEAEEQGFGPLYAWLGSAPPSSLAARGYPTLIQQWRTGTLPRRAGTGTSKRQQRMRVQDDAVDAFCAWLARTHDDGRGGERSSEPGTEDVSDEVRVWMGRYPELSAAEVATLLFFGRMGAYAAEQ